MAENMMPGIADDFVLDPSHPKGCSLFQCSRLMDCFPIKYKHGNMIVAPGGTPLRLTLLSVALTFDDLTHGLKLKDGCILSLQTPRKLFARSIWSRLAHPATTQSCILILLFAETFYNT
jgi:hypothetical protein